MAYQVDCSQDDGFMIKSQDVQEVIDHVKEHAKEKHDMEMSDDDARDMIKQVS